MTILGLILDGPEHVLLWTDSECYAGDSTMSLAPKLNVNAAACAAGVGTGSAPLLQHASRVLVDGFDFDAMPEAIAEALRIEAAKAAVKINERRRYAFAAQTYAAAGWSNASGRFLAWEMSGAAFFVPTLESRLARPYLPEIDTVRADDRRGILRLAVTQMHALRSHIPGATGGPLTICELRPGSVQTWRIDGWFDKSQPAPAALESGCGLPDLEDALGRDAPAPVAAPPGPDAPIHMIGKAA